MASRFDKRPELTIERLNDFVALDNLTAQTPLIEVSRSGTVRVWVAYDLTRTIGTYTAVDPDGSVMTVTRYPSGITHEIINRPPYRNVKRVHKPKRSYPKVRLAK